MAKQEADLFTAPPEVKKAKSKSVAILSVDKPVQLVPVPGTPAALLTIAIEKGLGMDQLERLIAMQDQWEAKQAKKAYQKAYARFQEICPDLVKNRTGYDNRYRFQDLPDIIKHIRKPLAECGLSYHWGQKDEPGKVSIWCIIEHEDGHREVGEPLEAAPDGTGNKADLHAKGSTISYLRRYTLTGMLGLASADIDDDAKAAQKKLPLASVKQFEASLKKVMAGEAVVETVKKYYSLSEDQEQALQKAEDEFKKPKA